MSPEQNKEIIRRLLEEGLAHGNKAVAEELPAKDFVDHNPLPGLSPDKGGFIQSFAVFRSDFPDFRYTIEDMVAEDDKAVVRFAAHGTHREEFIFLFLILNHVYPSDTRGLSLRTASTSTSGTRNNRWSRSDRIIRPPPSR